MPGTEDTVVDGYDPDELCDRWQELEYCNKSTNTNSIELSDASISSAVTQVITSLGIGVHAKAGAISSSEYSEYRHELKSVRDLKQIRLESVEYAHVMSELNMNLSDEDRKHALIKKPIGDYYYTVINRGFDGYTIVGREPIN